MTIEIHHPEVERIVNEAVISGQYLSPQEVVIAALTVWRGSRPTEPLDSCASPVARNLVELFENSPFKGLNMEFERDRTDFGREIDL